MEIEEGVYEVTAHLHFPFTNAEHNGHSRNITLLFSYLSTVSSMFAPPPFSV